MRLSALDRFCADCGLAAPLEVEVAATGLAASRHAIAQPFALFGRSPDATLCLDDEAVSQRHVYLQVVHGRAFVIDLESRARMRLDDQPASAGWLRLGDVLGLGPFRLSLPGEPGDEPGGNPLDDEVRGPERSGLASFDLFIGDKLQAKWRMNRALALVGRSTRCRVRLPDPSVSRIHCSMVATPRGVWLVDLLSREGTMLRGEPVRFVRLEEGDQVEIGIYRLRIRYHNLAAVQGAMVPAAAALPPLRPPTAVASPVVVMGDGPGAYPPAPASLVGGESQVVASLVQQFSLMQQNMFEQFQQTLVMMAQMMSQMHQEHAKLMREEMAHFHRATAELQQLYKEARAAGVAPAAAPPPPAPLGEAPLKEVPLAEPPVPPSGRWQPGTWPGGMPNTPPPVPPSAPPAAAPKPAARPAEDDAPEPMIELTAPTAAAADNAANDEPESDAVHAWLTGRIAELESERQSRWQKILGFLRGG